MTNNMDLDDVNMEFHGKCNCGCNDHYYNFTLDIGKAIQDTWDGIKKVSVTASIANNIVDTHADVIRTGDVTKYKKLVEDVTKPFGEADENWGDVVQEIKDRSEDAKEIAKKAVRGAGTIYLSPFRGSYLGLVRINALGFANKLKKARTWHPAKYKQVLNRWYKWGGKRQEFDDIVTKGSKEKPLFMFLARNKSADGSESLTFYVSKNIDYLNATGVEEVTAMLTAASPIVVAIADIIGGLSGDNKTDEEIKKMAQEQMTTFLQGAANEFKNPQPEFVRSDPVPSNVEQIKKDFLSEEVMKTTGIPLWVWIVIAAGTAGIIAVITKSIIQK